MPGAKEMTSHFFSHGIPQAIATSSSSTICDTKYETHKRWLSQFTQIVRGDDPELKQGKPAQDIFLLAAKRLGVEPAKCLVFEDAPAGTEAAIAAGMSVVVVPHPEMKHNLFKNPSQIIPSLNDFDPQYWGLPRYT